MDILVFILILAAAGLILGGLARFAVPGPDPMSLWATIALGIGGALVGGAAGRLLGFDGGGGVLFALVGGIALLIVYRRFAQGRGITGPGARRTR